MSIERSTFVELTHSMLYAVARDELNISQAARVLHACAQPTTTETTFDITHQLRERLTDWSQESKARLIAVECVALTFKCNDVHGPCERGEHSVLMARVMAVKEWHPEGVVSQHQFDEVLLEIVEAHHPHREGETRFVASHRRGTLAGAFAEMFGADVEETIDSTIEDFRAELDALFPSTPTHGKEEGHEPSG